MSFAGLSEWRAKLAILTEALGKIAGGSLLDEAAPEIAARALKIATPTLARHRRDGAAQKALKVYINGPIIKLDVPEYVRTHGWWPFRRGMPQAVLKFAAGVMASKYLDAIGDDAGSARMMAEAIASENATKAADAFKADTAKIARRQYRESEAGKAARREAAKARRAAKKATK